MVSESSEIKNSSIEIKSALRNRLSAYLHFLPALRFSERKLLLAIFDLILLNSSFILTLHSRVSPISPAATDRHPMAWFALLSGLWLSCAFITGCYDLLTAGSVLRSWWRTGTAIVLTWVAFLLIPFITPDLPTSRLEVLTFPAVAAVQLGLWRLIYATLFVRPNFQQRAIVVGAGWAGKTLVQALQEMSAGNGRGDATVGYRILGFTDDDEAKQGQLIEGVAVLGNRHDLVRLAHQLRPHEIVVAITHLEQINSELFDAIQECRELGISITTMAGLYTRLTGRVPIEHAGRTLEVALPTDESASHRFYPVLQRVFDIIGSLFGCVLLLAVIPFVWLANQISAPGPLFFGQDRVGRGGRIFQVYKFRSMIVDAEKFSGAVWAEENDPRITPVGRLLRGTRLDEVPQFWNVLLGQMSLIGPRPERPHFVSQLAKEIPFYRARHAVKPGLTGWAQVRYRYGASVEDALIKLQYDLYYIKNQGLLLDLEIILKTVGVVLGFKGR
jgi:exopolysaccharide biosynthesis polyprenyl glycosylphosphotransferase